VNGKTKSENNRPSPNNERLELLYDRIILERIVNGVFRDCFWFIEKEIVPETAKQVRVNLIHIGLRFSFSKSCQNKSHVAYLGDMQSPASLPGGGFERRRPNYEVLRIPRTKLSDQVREVMRLE
jgi:hypothetical protein